MGNQESDQLRPSSFRQEIYTLRFVAAPLLVLALGLGVFEHFAPDPARLSNLLLASQPAAGEASPRILLREAAARTISMTTQYLYLVTAVFASCVYATIAWRAGGRRLLVLLAILGAIVAATGIAINIGTPVVTEGSAAIAPAANRIHEWISALPLTVLEGFYESQQLGAELLDARGPVLLNMVGLLAAILAFAAACAILAPPADTSTEAIQDIGLRSRRLRHLLDAGSAQLIVGILQIIAWLRWPASVVGDETTAAEAMNLVLAVSVFWGAVFTGTIAALYLPAAMALRYRAERVLGELLPQHRPADVQEWLRQHGFLVSLRDQLPQVATILGPLLAAPLGSWLAALAGAGS